jgi:TonB-dependent SusC/RagA subfamily outer membrane receptor
MIIQLMLYSLVTATFLALAAVAAEAGLRLYGRSARWVWIAALTGSIALPLVGVVAPDLQPAGRTGSLVGDLVSSAQTLVLPSMVESIAAVPSWTAELDVALLVAWGTMTSGLVMLLLWSVRRLARERRDWRSVSVGGAPAWLSGDVGPAVVGIRAASIVVPAWVLELEHDVQRLISLHEEEHLRAGDLPLMMSGLLLVLLAPWNPLLWWQLRRLRLAVEADCDGRVLKRGVDVLAYSCLLLEVGHRSARNRLPALAFIKQTYSLARRIHLMTWKPRMRLGRALGAGTLAVTFGMLACETPTVHTIETDTQQARLVAEGPDGMTVMVRQGDSGEPLFVLDGVIVQTQRHEIDGKGHMSLDLGGLETIDIGALDIESIEVIKGEVATGLYGERAANGVVIITTKKGEADEHLELEPVVERL